MFVVFIDLNSYSVIVTLCILLFFGITFIIGVGKVTCGFELRLRLGVWFALTLFTYCLLYYIVLVLWR